MTDASTDGAGLTAEELNELLHEGEPTYEPAEDDGTPKPIPVAVEVVFRDEVQYPYHTKPYGCAFTPNGLYVKGSTDKDSDVEEHLIVPYSAIRFIRYDMEAMEEQIAQAAARFAEDMEKVKQQATEQGDDPT